MSLCGVLSSGSQPRFLDAALSKLKYGPADTTASIATDEIVLGVANDGVLFSSATRPGIFAAFDGVLFNRAELLASLAGSLTPSSVSDAHLTALAYGRWGEAFPAELDGEFAFALFDGQTEKLVLGRDVVGCAGLYYARLGNDVAFSSELQALFAIPGVSAQVDDESVARFAALRPEHGRTLFRNVSYPPSAHVVVLETGGRVRVTKIWSPEEQSLLRLRDPQEYSELLHSALLRAVERRLPAEGVVASQLSSGFDSAGVTALAAQVLARQNRTLLAYTSVPTHRSDASAVIPGWFADEWPIAHRVAEMYPNIEHIRIPTGNGALLPAVDALTQLYSGPPFFIRNAAWMCELHRDAQARGATVMFNGQMGNLTASYDGGKSLFDLRRRHDWLGLAKAIRWRKYRGASCRGLLARTWMPSNSTRTAVRRMIGKRVTPFHRHSLLNPNLYRDAGLTLRTPSPLGNPVDGDRRNSAAWRLSIMRIVDFGGVAAGERRLFGMRRADPTSDRRVIELCLSIPDEVYLMGNEPRDLYRHAMRDVLPPELLRQAGGGLQSSDFLENFRERVEEFRQEMRLLHGSPGAQRVLNLARMQQMLDAFPSDLQRDRAELDQRYNYTFGGALALGRFLRRLEEGEIFPRQ